MQAKTKKSDPPIPIERIARAFNQTYQTIGADLQAIDGRGKKNRGIARRDLLDCCFDYVGMYGGLTKDEAKSVTSWILSLPEKELRRVTVAIFPYARYE